MLGFWLVSVYDCAVCLVLLRVIDMSCNEYIEMVTCVSNVQYKLSETSVRRQAVHTEFEVIEPHTNS